jgi:hypothetical protein
MAFPKREEEVDKGSIREQKLRMVQNPQEHSDQPLERDAEQPISLVHPEEAAQLRERWRSIQTQFVDEPRGAVKEADALVADVIRRITESFGSERSGLEQQWSRGGDVSTEELRVAMQHYRSFFDRLLSR